MREIRKDLNKWKDINFQKLIFRFMILSIKVAAGVSVEIDKVILKFMWNCQPSGKAMLNKNKFGGFIL